MGYLACTRLALTAERLIVGGLRGVHTYIGGGKCLMKPMIQEMIGERFDCLPMFDLEQSSSPSPMN